MSSWEEEHSGMVDVIIDRMQEYWDDVDNGIWRTANGTRIAIKDMKTTHIKNCLKMIYRSNGNWRREYLRALQRELLRRRWEERLKNESNERLKIYFRKPEG